MNLGKRTFIDNSNGKILRVIDSFDNIAILENKERIDTRRLMNTELFTEQIESGTSNLITESVKFDLTNDQVDPSTFFNNQNAYNSLADKIKNISTESLNDDEPTPVTVNVNDRYTPPDLDDSAIIYSSIEDERDEISKKYNIPTDNESLIRQKESFSKILGEDDELGVERIEVKRDVERIEVERIEVKRDVDEVIVEDPIYIMFRGAKRSVDFNIDINIENKIPRLDFIEMMEDSYEKSIIDFISDEFTKKLISDPNLLKELISNKIRDMVYNKKVTNSKTVKKATVKNTPVKLVDEVINKPITRSRIKRIKKEIE